MNSMADVRKFLLGSVKISHSHNSLDVIKTSLNLLKNTPSAREAVLDYFSSIFIFSINDNSKHGKGKSSNSIKEANLLEIHAALSSCVHENSHAWASTISVWAFRLLGKISSSNYARDLKINERLQYWMSCQASRLLIDLSVQCLQRLDNEGAFCLETLFNVRALYSPDFDWVVAHIGCCFPNLVIPLIVQRGLEEFHRSENSSFKQNYVNQKLRSLVGILDYLSSSHFPILKTVMVNLFLTSLNDTYLGNDSRTAKVPFLLYLASYSPIILKTLTDDISQVLNMETMPKLTLLSKSWVKYFNNDVRNFINTAVQLILETDQGGFQILNLLLNMLSTNAHSSYLVDHNSKRVCREILESVLETIELTVRAHDLSSTHLPFLASIQHELNNVIALFLSDQSYKVKTAVRLLCACAKLNPSITVSAATTILLESETNYHLSVLVWLLTDHSNSWNKHQGDNILQDQDHFTQIVEQTLREVQYSWSSRNACVQKLYKNFVTLLKWENSGRMKVSQSKFVVHSLRANLSQILVHLSQAPDFELASLIAQVLSYIIHGEDGSFNEDIQITLKLTCAIISYFYKCVAVDDIVKRLRSIKLICKFINAVVSSNQFSRILALHKIFEASLFGEMAKYYGAVKTCKSKFSEPKLLQQNHKQGTGAILAQRHSSVFHAGIIGYGTRESVQDESSSREFTDLNYTLLVDVLKFSCKDSNSCSVVNTENLTIVSLLLIELISPDVMYNGLPWPDEEFTKVTVERDLEIQRLFKEYPILWLILRLTAWYRPALAYCSVLMRAIVATVLTVRDLDQVLSALSVMSLGQLLPPPLNRMTDIIPKLESQQMYVLIKDCIWMYMQENVPSPVLFTRSESSNSAWRDIDASTPNSRFTEVLRLIMLNNINDLGFLYGAIFFKHQQPTTVADEAKPAVMPVGTTVTREGPAFYYSNADSDSKASVVKN